MGTYWILVIIVTFLYVIYYAYQIYADTYASKGNKKSSTEEIPVEQVVIRPTVVKETALEPPPDAASEPADTQSSGGGTTAEEAIARAREGEEEVAHAYYSGMYLSQVVEELGTPEAREKTNIAFQI